MNDALGQRAAAVRAFIFEGEDPVVGATKNGDIPGLGFKDAGAALGNVLDPTDFDPFAYG
jgi:hypothetical protein